jgi:uncharacterized protein YcfJ
MTFKTRLIATAMIAAFTLSQVPTMSMAAGKSYCQSYARKEANRRAHAANVVGGAVAGAIAGALVGALIGGRHSVGRGAIIGGVGGTVVGGVSTNSRWHRIYNNAYANCRNW